MNLLRHRFHGITFRRPDIQRRRTSKRVQALVLECRFCFSRLIQSLVLERVLEDLVLRPGMPQSRIRNGIRIRGGEKGHLRLGCYECRKRGRKLNNNRDLQKSIRRNRVRRQENQFEKGTKNVLSPLIILFPNMIVEGQFLIGNAKRVEGLTISVQIAIQIPYNP